MNGLPLAGGLLTVYQGGSSSALANTFQDIGLTIPAKNPLAADASGRVPMFFVADGTYGLRLTDANGVQGNGGFFYPSVPSIGASSSGGGGTPVDPTTVFSTGDWKWRPSSETLSGWVRLNGNTIGNATSGAGERANADTQALFIYAWNLYPNSKCPVIGGRGASGLADFNASKRLVLLDMRGRGPLGLDDMGNTAAGNISAANMPGSPDTVTTPAGYGGEANHTLQTTEIPAHTHGVTDPGHVHTQAISPPGGAPGGFVQANVSGVYASSGINTFSNVTGIAINNAGGGASHNNMGLFALGSHFWKL